MWQIAGKTLTSRLFLGTADYPSPDIMCQAIDAAKTNVITVSLKRQAAGAHNNNPFWELIKQRNCLILPNTAGCHSAKEAVTMAQLGREIFATNWVKLEIFGDDYNLQPDPIELLHAARELKRLGFEVFPYCTDDLVICRRLVDLGLTILMPWAAPIGSGQGLLNPFALATLRERLPQVRLIVDAGIGRPSHAVQALEMGVDAVLVNSAVALADDPVVMAQAFAHAVVAGRFAYAAGPMPKRNFAKPSTPLIDTPFWLQGSKSDTE